MGIEGIRSKKTPYQGMWIFLPLMVLPSVVLTWLFYYVIAKWQSRFGWDLNWATAKIFGCGCGVAYHIICALTGVFDEDRLAVKKRLKEFSENIVVSVKLAFSCYCEDVKTLGLAYWIDLAVIGLNAGIFVDAIFDYLALRGF